MRRTASPLAAPSDPIPVLAEDDLTHPFWD